MIHLALSIIAFCFLASFALSILCGVGALVGAILEPLASGMPPLIGKRERMFVIDKIDSATARNNWRYL